MTVCKRLAVTVPAALVVFAGSAGLAPAPSGATQCGPGTVYDAPTDTCLIPPAPVQWNAPPPPAPPPPLAPPPAPPSILPPGMPPLQVCPPIPFVPVCFPIN